jgi:ABC-type taurine transport system substrate-binding protein
MASYTDIQSNVSQSNRKTFKSDGTDNLYGKEGQLVTITTVDSDNRGLVGLANASGDIPIGVLLHGPSSSATTSVDVDVLLLSTFTFRAIAGAAITAGARVCCNATTDGKVITAASSQYPIGVALETAASGDYVEILPMSMTVHA